MSLKLQLNANKMTDQSKVIDLSEYLAKLRALPKDVPKNTVFDTTFWFAINEYDLIQRLVYYIYFLSLIESSFGIHSFNC